MAKCSSILIAASESPLLFFFLHCLSSYFTGDFQYVRSERRECSHLISLLLDLCARPNTGMWTHLNWLLNKQWMLVFLLKGCLLTCNLTSLLTGCSNILYMRLQELTKFLIDHRDNFKETQRTRNSNLRPGTNWIMVLRLTLLLLMLDLLMFWIFIYTNKTPLFSNKNDGFYQCTFSTEEIK